MRRVLVISLAVIGAVVGLIVIGVAALFHSAPGRSLIADRAEQEIAEAVGGAVTIGALKGPLPGTITLENVSFTDDNGEWAHIDAARLRWRPQALLGGRVEIDIIEIDGGAVFREPPGDGEDEEEDLFWISLPESLPHVKIGALTINNIRSELGGVAAQLEGAGAMDIGGERIDAQLQFNSANDADQVDITVNIDPDADQIIIDAMIAAGEDGVIASLADLGGPLNVRVASQSPTGAAEITIDAQIGAIGAVEAMVLADLRNLLSLNADGAFVAGPRLATIDALSDPVRFNIYLQDEKNGARVTINRLISAAGAVAGDISWRSSRAGPEFTTDLRASIAEDYRADLTQISGRDLTVSGTLAQRGDEYAIAARLRGDNLDAALDDGATDLRKRLSGRATIALQTGAPVTDGPASASAQFTVDLDDAASFRAMSVALGDALTVIGDADYRFDDEAIRFEGDIDAAPSFVTALAPGFVPQDRVVATLIASGKPDQFTLDADLEAPAIAIGDNAAPPFTATIDVAGLPFSPSGDVAARAVDGAGLFSLMLRSSQDGTIAAQSLTYSGADFSLTGAGAYRPDQQAIDIDLNYAGGADAFPWPGLNLAGDITINGAVAREGADTNIALAANALRINTISIAGLNLNADGPPDAIQATMTAARIRPADDIVVEGVSAAAIADAGDARIRFTAFDALVNDNAARLTEPGVVSFADGVGFDTIRVGWGRTGRIDIDARIAETRWNGAIGLTDVNIPGTDGRATAAISFDTDAATPATGEFALQSLISETAASLSGTLRWNGDALIIASARGSDGLDMSLSLPVSLVRDPGVSIAAGGALDGYVRYQGAVEPFAAFFPPELQTLEGDLNVDFQISGVTDAPILAGAAQLSDGAYTELQSGLSLKGLHTEASASYEAGESRIAFTGGGVGAQQTGEDTLSIAGEAMVGRNSSLDLKIDMDGLVLSAAPVNRVRADGAITVAGPFNAIAATGEITVNELDAEIITPESTGLVPIDVVNIDNIAEAPAPDAPSTAANVDIRIIADDRIFVRGRGIDSEWSAEIRALTTRGEPVLIGAMRLRRGALDFSGRRFDITRGVIEFDQLSPNNPTLDMRAEYEASDDTTAAIVISGRAQSPSVELVSTPSLPQEDIMALILFGKSASEMSAFESLQVAQALASLGGIGPFGGGGVTGSIRQATGLDMLNLDIDPETGGGSLAVGKYVADGLFVSASQDATGDGGAVTVEYEITDNISVETELRQDGDQTVSANWKTDF